MIGTLVAALGTLGLYWQIYLTRKAVEDTGQATKAMARQNELTEEAMRPWLEIDVDFDFMSEPPATVVSVMVNARNIGKIPARNCNIDNVIVNGPGNPVAELRKRAREPLDPRGYRSEMIVLPGGTSTDQELLFFAPKDSERQHFLPGFMIILSYELPDGEEARTAAWFGFGPRGDNGRVTRFDWDDPPPADELFIDHRGYLLAT